MTANRKCDAPLRVGSYPRQRVEEGKFLQKRAYARSPLLKTIALKGELSFGDPLLDSGVVPAGDERVSGWRALAHLVLRILHPTGAACPATQPLTQLTDPGAFAVD